VCGGSAAEATRAPQRAQKTSTPGVTGFEQDEQTAALLAGADSMATRPPHLGQKGSVGSTGVWQYRQGVFTAEAPPGLPSTFAETLVAGTTPGPALATAGTGMSRAPFATTGLPQSWQNLEAGSLSRPQKEQRITGRRRG